MLQIHRDYSKMVDRLSKPGIEILDSLTGNDCHILHMLLGCVGEMMEIELASKKLDEMSNLAERQNLSREQWENIYSELQKNIDEEIGDFFFFFHGLAKGLSVKFGFIEFDLFDINYETEFDLFDSAYKTSDDFQFMCHFERLFDLCKKAIIYEKKIDSEEIKNALINSYKSTALMICKYTPHNRNVLLELNMEKLLTGEKARYKKGVYSNQQANDRADKQ